MGPIPEEIHMLLAFDVGNTNIVMRCIQGKETDPPLAGGYRYPADR